MLRLFDMLFPPRVDEKVLREVSEDDFLALMSPRLVPCTRPGTIALLPFPNAQVRAVIHEAKYHGNTRALELLARTLAEYLRDSDEMSRSLVIVPVPLGQKRRKERGFNQTEEIARRASKELGLVIDTTLLVRTRETVSQVSLPREKREENMRGAFGAAHPADPASTYMLIDDVVTTGATLGAAEGALRAAGAVHIIPLALGH